MSNKQKKRSSTPNKYAKDEDEDKSNLPIGDTSALESDW